MAIKPSRVFGKPIRPVKPKLTVGVAQPGAVPTVPRPTVRQDVPSARPPAPVAFTPYQPPPSPPPDVGWRDPTYLDTKSNIKTGLDNLKGYLTQQGTALGQDYGIDFQYAPVADDPTTPQNEENPFALKQLGTNPDGSAKYFDLPDNIDVTNPFSRAALLKRSHDQHQRAIQNGATGSQLYSGARQGDIDNETFNYGAGTNSMLADFARNLGGYTQQWLTGTTAATGQGLQARADAIARHANDPAAPPPAFTGGSAAPGSNPYVPANSVTPGAQPKEYVSPAVKKYLQQAAKAKPGKTKPPKKTGRTGGAYAP